MSLTRPALRLTHDGARVLLDAAIAHALGMGVPQCIAVVDEGCNLVAFVRMDGARVLSIRTAQRKAMTAATTGRRPARSTPPSSSSSPWAATARCSTCAAACRSSSGSR